MILILYTGQKFLLCVYIIYRDVYFFLSYCNKKMRSDNLKRHMDGCRKIRNTNNSISNYFARPEPVTRQTEVLRNQPPFEPDSTSPEILPPVPENAVQHDVGNQIGSEPQFNVDPLDLNNNAGPSTSENLTQVQTDELNAGLSSYFLAMS